MTKIWMKYRLIFLIVILIVAFLFFKYYSSKENGHSGGTNKPTTGLDRNSNRISISQHANCRMECRDITEEEIREILSDGKINYYKSSLNNEGEGTYALEGYSRDKQHLRIVFATKQNKLVVVTCIDLDKEWPCDCN